MGCPSPEGCPEGEGQEGEVEEDEGGEVEEDEGGEVEGEDE